VEELDPVLFSEIFCEVFTFKCLLDCYWWLKRPIFNFQRESFDGDNFPRQIPPSAIWVVNDT
jgi:hypothetical protein